jgi:hypothetical protein
VKILGIHYFFPPTRVVASRRLWYFYQGLEKQLLESGELTPESIHVITSQQARTWPQEERFIHSWQLYHVAGKGLREYLTKEGSTAIKASAKSGKLYKWAAAIRHAYPFLYLTDEGGPSYRKAAYDQAVQLIETKGITHLVSSYRPWVDHLIAAKLKDRFPHLVWLADFRDLPVDPVRRDVWWPGLQRAFSRRIVRKADQVIAVSEGQAEQLKSLGRPVLIVYGGMERLPELTSPLTDEFVISYTGSIYPELQSLDPLGEALKSLLLNKELCYVEVPNAEKIPPKIKVQYAGKDALVFQQWAEKYGLLSICEIRDVITQREAQEQQANAAVNLLLSWSASDYYGVLTAKLYDYLAAGRPILALVNGPEDPELTRVIEGSGAGRCAHTAPDQAAIIENWLAELYLDWQGNDGCLSWTMNKEKLTYLLDFKAR